MDIAKLRKKLKEAKETKKAEGVSEPSIPEKEEPPIEISPDVSTTSETPQDIEPTTEKDAEIKTKGYEPPSKEKIPSEAEEKKEEIVELLTFKLSKEDYAFKVCDVEEILRPQNVTPLPRAEEFITGITSLRGKIIPLIDLRKRFELSEEAGNNKAKILILKGTKGSIGAVVDKVINVTRIPTGLILNPPSHLTESQQRFIEGVVVVEGRFISIVKMEEVLNFKVGER